MPAMAPMRATMRWTVRRSMGACAVGEETAGGSDVFVVGGGPFGEQFDEVVEQGDHAVVAEFADRDAEPVAVVADPGHRVSGEFAEFGGA